MIHQKDPDLKVNAENESIIHQADRITRDVQSAQTFDFSDSTSFSVSRFVAGSESGLDGLYANREAKSSSTANVVSTPLLIQETVTYQGQTR